MKSPPLEFWLTGSAGGGIASAAASFGPGIAALGRCSGKPETVVLAAAGVLSAAAPAMVAPLRKFRRLASGAPSCFGLSCPALLRFDMASSPGARSDVYELIIDDQCRLHIFRSSRRGRVNMQARRSCHAKSALVRKDSSKKREASPRTPPPRRVQRGTAASHPAGGAACPCRGSGW